ncbi:uncharacterized protein LOC144478558 [Augochlora pura]
MNTLEGMLTGIKNYNDNYKIKYGMQDYQHSSVSRKSTDCNEVADISSVDCMRPECIKILKEIKECTKTLEEQLAIMNKNMKTKKCRQQKDIVTQEPEKENISIQEPSIKDFKFVNCTYADLKLNELPVKIFQQSNKEMRKLENVHGETKCCNERGRIYSTNKMFHRSGNKNKSNTDQSHTLKTIESTNYTNDCSSFKDLIVSTSDDKSLSSEKMYLCPFPDQTSIFSNRNLLRKKEKRTKLNGLISQPLKREERAVSLGNIERSQERCNCSEKTITMLFLTRGVNNSYLKSRYKRMELKNFKPKCLINELNSKSDEILKKRRMQVPTVFKQLKSSKCKIEKCLESTENTKNVCCHIRSRSNSEISNLWTTVCTQSSNLYITSATSVSRVSFVRNSDNYAKERTDKSGTCVLS